MRILVACAVVVLFLFGTYESGDAATASLGGRYQLVKLDSHLALVDSETGRVWLMVPRPHEMRPAVKCRGMSNCFVEIDRQRLTESGWVSEILPGQR